MFGYIKPKNEELRVKEYTLYNALYCGLCRTERRHTGHFSALTLSYDFVFLYLLRAECEKLPTEFKKRSSCFHTTAEYVAVENKELRYAAGCAALLQYLKVQDNIADEPFFEGLPYRIALPYCKYSLKKAKKITDLPVNTVTNAFNDLTAAEQEGAHPEELAILSGKMLSILACHGIGDELAEYALAEIAQQIGEYIYLLDAADDLQDDCKKGRFNPFKGEALNKEDLKYALDIRTDKADAMLDRLPIYDAGYRAILKNILFEGLDSVATEVIYRKRGNLKE